ncbi:helix-loop-helix DNA-binding domain-containing protein [Purpureocillium lavendulum]|uniref:Helix-loop-helix DNA-binding domain-containing protein n=1 Tax=Purpureocillium lavendulum TaxID=1247861 RepID=A0AB34FF25_9HYPO|nr:helix-loop-helix DNA-binding domain-containing protein [Purpureocillium lavendulum]
MDLDAAKQLQEQQQSTSAANQTPSVVSPDSSSQPPQQASAWNSPTPGSSSRISSTFEFTSAPSDVTIPSFDPAIAAFADMSFTQPHVPSPYLQDRKSLPTGANVGQQPECFQRRDMHDKKRFKADPDTPALDSIDYWINFDDDWDKMGSVEIDYSKRNDPIYNRTGTVASTMPGLGSGLYSTAVAPFREEDFIDDTAFDQTLSDDEDVFDSAHTGDQVSDMGSMAAPPQPVPAPQNDGSLQASPQGWNRADASVHSEPMMEDTPRQMRGDIWDAVPRGANQTLSPDEQRRLLEIALNTGRMPGSFIPPNGFGIGFGAGLGARPPAEFEKRSSVSVDRPSETPSWTSKGDEASERAQKQQGKKPSIAKAGPSKKPGETAKPKSADRIAHNDVERKYRTNLKVKIAELRDAVPALQSPNAEGDSDGGNGNQGTPKVSKGTVLTKATEYIQQLEQRNKTIMQEHQQLARRLQAFETLFNSANRPDLMMPNHSMTLFDPRGFC